MMYPRLKLAKNLLTDEGVIFISIDDNEVENLKKICNEIFGETNFVGELVHQRAKGGGQAKYIVKGHDYILVYSKKISMIKLLRKKVIQQKTYEIDGETYLRNDDVIRKTFGKYDKSGDRRCFYEELIEYKGIEKKKEIDQKIEDGELLLEKNTNGYNVIVKYEKVGDAKSKMYSIIKVLSEEGKKELEKLELSCFDYPKPTELIKQLIDAGTDKNSIVLDFFSGSATTAHGTIQINSEDNGNRKFILVQLPEATDEKSESYKAGYKTITELGKERIRRSSDKILSENQNKNLDIGFKVFKLDSSNLNKWDPDYHDPEQAVLTSVDNIKPDRNELDLLYEIMIKYGIDLTLPIEEYEISNKKIYSVGFGALLICLDNEITSEIATEIIKLKKELSPETTRVVVKDNGFKSDSDKTNIKETLKTNGIEEFITI